MQSLDNRAAWFKCTILSLTFSWPKIEGEVSFSCPTNQGAVLSLPINAKKEDTVARTKFGKWLTRLIDPWFAWARLREPEVDQNHQMEYMIFVIGRHRTRSCANVAFPGGQKDAQVAFRANGDCSGDTVTSTGKFYTSAIERRF